MLLAVKIFSYSKSQLSGKENGITMIYYSKGD